MTLPLLLSVPHAGLAIPEAVKNNCILSTQDIIEDGDEGAAEIYLPLEGEVSAVVTTVVARAIVDVNRAEDDFGKDGIIKTHTCWNVPIYNAFPSQRMVRSLLKTFYKPYHSSLTQSAHMAQLGVDCHTMAAQGPPVGPDAEMKRPAICISNAGSTCPDKWLKFLAACFEEVFEKEVSLNTPFKGGYIIRSHANELPWVQLELSRDPFFSNKEKSILVFKALEKWCQGNREAVLSN